MQYAVQIEGVWHDLFQSLEKSRDAISASSAQMDGEMSSEFGRLGICDGHMTKKWRGNRDAGACHARVREAKTVDSGVHWHLDCDDEISDSFGMRHDLAP
jgi:hypothetical protein